jgi:hypothetical protein
MRALRSLTNNQKECPAYKVGAYENPYAVFGEYCGYVVLYFTLLKSRS